MRQLRDDTHLILDGEVRVYRRERSKRWQAAFVIDGHTIRISTGKRDLESLDWVSVGGGVLERFRSRGRGGGPVVADPIAKR